MQVRVKCISPRLQSPAGPQASGPQMVQVQPGQDGAIPAMAVRSCRMCLARTTPPALTAGNSGRDTPNAS